MEPLSESVSGEWRGCLGRKVEENCRHWSRFVWNRCEVGQHVGHSQQRVPCRSLIFVSRNGCCR